MAAKLPGLEIGGKGGGREEMMRLLEGACAAYGRRDVRKAADGLCGAERVARRDGLHREAAKIRRAIGMLAQGGKPRLLTRGAGYLEGGREE